MCSTVNPRFPIVQRIKIPGLDLGEVKLSAFDCRFPGFFSRRVLIFRTSHDRTPAELTAILSEALSYLVKKVPALGGTIHKADRSHSPTSQDGWKMIANGDGINLTTRDLRQSLKYSDLEQSNFQPIHLSDAELMPISPTFKTEPYNAADFQLNFIDGGILLSCCISHIVADGTSVTEIFRLLAQYCRGVQEPPGSSSRQALLQVHPPVGLDRSAMVGLKPYEKLWSPADNPAMYIRPPGQTMPLEKPPCDEVMKIYQIRGPQLAQLKRDASSQQLRLQRESRNISRGGEETNWVSTNDAIISVIWRMLLRNRISAGVVPDSPETPSCLYFPVSAQRISGLVEPGYIGNTVCNRVVSHITQSQVLRDDDDDVISGSDGIGGSSSLGYLAAAVRTEIGSITRDTVASYCAFAESAPSVSDFTFRAMSTKGSQSITLTSLLNSGASIYGSDWGDALGGPVQRLRCTDVGFTGIIRPCNLILPRLPDGGCEIALAMFVDGIDAAEADTLARRYISFDE